MPSVLNHPLGSSRFSNLVRMAARYGCEGRYLPRLVGVGLMSLLRQPVIAYEALRHGKAIRSTDLPRDPVFVIGHWRSGTTHLQNILSKDPQFGSVTLKEAAMPLDFLTLGNLLSGPMAASLPKKRLMDNVAVAADCPWEEELALACTSPLSFYHVSFFPKAVGCIFQESILFNDKDENLITCWKNNYKTFLRKVQMVRPNRRLLLKNPANSARIDLILRLFPEARFIHIHRDPLKVYASTIHLYLKAQEEWGFHRPDRSLVVEHVLQTYPLLMQAYLDQRSNIPEDRLVEVAFKDLQNQPMQVLENIYSDLRLPGFETAAPHFETYLHSVRGYTKNRLELEPEETQQLRIRWKHFFETFGYGD
ncbi:MAG: sulfotransferase [Puniceicoccaceae bacterium]